MAESHQGMDEPFFHRPTVGSSIDDLAASESVTIFYGAGVAKDRGSPDWYELAQILLTRALEHHDVAAIRSGAAEYARIASLGSSPPTMASAIRSLVRDFHQPQEQLDTWIRSALYDEFSPGGNLADLIALLAVQLRASGKKVTLVTTNYDNYVEDAWDKLRSTISADQDTRELAGYRLVSLHEPPGELGDDEIAVVHLHGVVMSAMGQPSTPVFCEVDYAHLSWQENFLVELLRDSAVLFVGSSLTEPYLPSCLARARVERDASGERLFADTPRPWVALIPRQGQPWLNEWLRSDRSARIDDICRIVSERFNHIGVVALFPDFYSQVSQFLVEVGMCSGMGRPIYRADDDLRYGRRLMSWAAAWAKSQADAESLQSVQGQARSRLARCKRQVLRDILNVPGTAGFKIEMWVRGQPDERHLTLWAGSEVLQMSTDAVHNAPIEHGSPYLAIHTFASGRPVGPSAPSGVHMGRWTNCISVPVWLEKDPWFRLPVGTIALLEKSTNRSVLADAGRQMMSTIARRLQEAGVEVLTRSYELERGESGSPA